MNSHFVVEIERTIDGTLLLSFSAALEAINIQKCRKGASIKMKSTDVKAANQQIEHFFHQFNSIWANVFYSFIDTP